MPCPSSSDGVSHANGSAISLDCPYYTTLNNLDQHVEQAKRNLQQCLEKRSTLLQQFNYEHDPLQQLPTDITSNIFMACLQWQPSLDMFDDVQFTENSAMPLLLGSICRYWRKVAWSTPQLWSVLCLGITDDNFKTRAWNELVVDWLNRSGHLPLYISMFSGNPHRFRNYSDALVEMQSLVTTVAQYASRWKVLHLCLPAELVASFCYCDPVPSTLESLTVGFLGPDDDIAAYNRRSPGKTEKARPKRVKLLHPQSWDVDELHWGDITHLELTEFECDQVLSIIRQARCIEELQLDEILSSFPLISTTRITLPFLHTLRVLSSRSTDVFLTKISCPSLKILCLCPAPLRGILDFIDYSACSLDSFTFNLSSQHFLNDLKLLFRSTPSLNRLEIVVETAFPVGFFQMFRQSSPTGVLIEGRNANEDTVLPCLRELTFWSCQNFDWSSIPLLLIGRPISSISVPLYCGELMELDDLTEILRFIELGVMITVTDTSKKDLISLCKQFRGL